VGSEYNSLPAWVSYWASIDKLHPLVQITDINGDGYVQLAEIAIDADMVVLATPEIAGLPYVISGLIAAGGLAAALSTADGLLLTISSALAHDTYYKTIAPMASTQKRVTISKLMLVVVALLAAYAASLKPGNILTVVGMAFSLAASTLFPVMVAAVFWRRANGCGAIAGMLVGFMVCVYYMLHAGAVPEGELASLWFGIAPISAGVFGVPAGCTALVLASLMTAPPDARIEGFIEQLRQPDA